jgi:hypothetical protein
MASHGVVGSWHVNLTVKGSKDPPHQVVMTFAEGGCMVETAQDFVSVQRYLGRWEGQGRIQLHVLHVPARPTARQANLN